jgi:hypothetical protein
MPLDNRPATYLALARELRRSLQIGDYDDGTALPTEGAWRASTASAATLSAEPCRSWSPRGPSSTGFPGGARSPPTATPASFATSAPSRTWHPTPLTRPPSVWTIGRVSQIDLRLWGSPTQVSLWDAILNGRRGLKHHCCQSYFRDDQ